MISALPANWLGDLPGKASVDLLVTVEKAVAQAKQTHSHSTPCERSRWTVLAVNPPAAPGTQIPAAPSPLCLFPVDIYQTAMLFPCSHKKHFVSLGAGLPKQLAPDPGQKLRFSAQQTREGRPRESGKEKERRKRSDAISDRGSAAFQKEQ